MNDGYFYPYRGNSKNESIISSRRKGKKTVNESISKWQFSNVITTVNDVSIHGRSQGGAGMSTCPPPSATWSWEKNRKRLQ